MNDHNRFIQLIAGRELGGLDAVESAELDGHLAGCAACMAEARAIADTAAEIAFQAPVRRPPEGMRLSILEAIHAEAAAEMATVPATAPGSAATAAGDRRSIAVRPARASEASSARLPGAWLARLRGPGLRLAAVGLVGVLVVASLGIGGRALDLQSQLDSQNRAVAEAQQHLAVQAAAMAVILDPEHVVAGLAAEPLAPSAIAQVVYRPGTAQAYLIADHLPATPPGYVYQLWYADGLGVHALSTFAFDGAGAFIAPFGVDLGGKAAAMVTLEATGGSTGEPGPQVVFGQLPPG